MPIPSYIRRAQLVIDGVAYELRDLSVNESTSVERERVTHDGGRTLGFTRGQITSRVAIEGEMMPAPARAETDQSLRDRIRAIATGQDLDAIAVMYGVVRQIGVMPSSTEVSFVAPTVQEPLKPAQPALKESFKPTPKSALDRLLDPSFELC